MTGLDRAGVVAALREQAHHADGDDLLPLDPAVLVRAADLLEVCAGCAYCYQVTRQREEPS